LQGVGFLYVFTHTKMHTVIGRFMGSSAL